ncbi:hypothetical protein LZ31DRAFT_635003 [Colletotrichum somersetense]|nr:hypothetical protein LZ31DRAFT_635003 [Colletotrichum somersetense]
MKRKRGDNEDSAAACLGPRQHVKDKPLQEGKSVRERVRPYLLAVGRVHADVLETTWSTGRNRCVEPGHVRELKEAFLKGGLERGAPENRIAVLCSAEERTLTTRWCKTRLGLETFNISTFEWMASLRIDDYWLPTLKAALGTLKALPLDEAQDLRQDDWNRLAAATADGRTQEAVKAAFYTGDSGDRSYRRTAGLLKTIDDATYRKVCQAIWTAPDLAFVDLKRLFCSKRLETETAVWVLHHVIGWIHHRSAVDLKNVNPKSKNKPQLVHHLQTALDGLRLSRGSADEYPRDTELRLQQRVLDFTCPYSKRFDHIVWAQLLRIVRRITDPGDNTYVLRPHWETADASEGGVYHAQVSTLVAAFCTKLFKLSGQSLGKTTLHLSPSGRVADLQTALPGHGITAHVDDGVDDNNNDGTTPPPPPGQRQQRQPDSADARPPLSAQKTQDRRVNSRHPERQGRAKSPTLFLSDDDDDGRSSASSPPPHRPVNHRPQQAGITPPTAAFSTTTTTPAKKPVPHWKTGLRAGGGGRRQTQPQDGD